MAQNNAAAKLFTKVFPRTTYRPREQDMKTTKKKKETYADHDEVMKFIATMKDRVRVFEASLEKQEQDATKLRELVDDLSQWA